MKFVFCEGGDDQAVAMGVAKSIGITDVQVEPFNGKDKLREFLRVVQTRPEFSRNQVTAVGIIRDADENGVAAFQSVRDALIANGFTAPNQNGGIATNGIKTGILVVGPRNGKGMIEDLCLDSVSNRPEFFCVDEYFDCIAQHSNRKAFSSKAKIRVWMASHEDYSAHVGAAAKKDYWPWDSPVFDSMKNFLRQL